MRVSIEIDDELLTEAMRVTGQKTRRATVEEALRRITRHNRLRQLIERTRGMGWEGDLDELRGGSTVVEDRAPLKKR
jgi:Arc/MetJ family transcription regulator